MINYHDFKGMGDYEPEYEEYEECRTCMQLGDQVDEATKYVKEILGMLYSKDELDVGLLDDSISNLCECLGLDIPISVPMVKRKETEIFNFAAELARNVK